MPIYILPDDSTVSTGSYFSAKQVGIKTYNPVMSDPSMEFCTCLKQCVPPLPAFTDEIGTDFYKNDIFRVFINPITDGTIELFIINKNLEETEVTDETYGTETEDSGVYTYLFDWYKIWDNIGYGRYSFRIDNKALDGTVIQSVEYPWFDLRRYTDRAAHGTVRIESLQNGKLQHADTYRLQGDLSKLRFRQQIRFNGSLVLSDSITENSDVQLNNRRRSTLQIKDQVFPEYTLTLKLVSAPQVAQTVYDYLFANSVSITDYNVYNHTLDPRNYNSKQLKSIPLKRVSNNFDSSSRAIRKTYSIQMEYDHKNVFKIND